jgi:HicB family
MHIEAHIDALRSDLVAAAGLGDEATLRVAEQLSRALGPAFRLRIQDILAEAALELNDQLASGHVELRLSAGDVGLAYAESAPEAEPAGEDDAQAARVTLRLTESLKARAEAAAAAEGISLNTWLVRATGRALERSRGGGPPGRRMKGYATS